ncbi:hypothetical protein BJX76DRAFT_333893 [Aspergillus varians]
MPTMASPTVLSARTHRRQELGLIMKSLDQAEPHLSPTDLKELRIRHLPMTLDGKEQPMFFTPYAFDVLEPESDSISDYPSFPEEIFPPGLLVAHYVAQYSGYCRLPKMDNRWVLCVSPQEGEGAPGTSSSSFGNFNFQELYDLARDCAWECSAVWHMPHSGAPHMVAIISTDIVADDSLLRSELMAITRIMHGRLRLKSLRPNVTAPVLLISAFGPHHLRVLESYHDGKELVVRATRLYDMRQRDEQLITTLAQWILGYASAESTQLG